jgi:hypothetical protein
VCFLFCFCNKILLDFCFSHVMFFFFLFHNLNLELGMFVFLFWFRKLTYLIIFVLVITKDQMEKKNASFLDV